MKAREYRLSEPANTYKIGDVLKAVEGSICPISCIENQVSCVRRQIFPSIAFWQVLDKVISDYLNAYTLKDLTNMEEGDFII